MMPDGGGWPAALDAYEGFLDEFEAALAQPELMTVPEDRLPRTPPGTPTPAERARGEALLARAARLEERLRQSARSVAGELAALPARRKAAASYRRSADAAVQVPSAL